MKKREQTTEEKLISVHGALMVRLSDICEQYVGTKEYQARIRANLNRLPFPAFKLDPSSHKSPWMVMVKDLAAYIDSKAAEATKSWETSQI